MLHPPPPVPLAGLIFLSQLLVGIGVVSKALVPVPLWLELLAGIMVKVGPYTSSMRAHTYGPDVLLCAFVQIQPLLDSLFLGSILHRVRATHPLLTACDGTWMGPEPSFTTGGAAHGRGGQ